MYIFMFRPVLKPNIIYNNEIAVTQELAEVVEIVSAIVFPTQLANS